ncbi:hypothetical protein [Macrococcoides canis]|uniref:baeRF6 domain-containing protein n=1 Tax=Macrococcoides canis TaxID=1855823 RepID=UPI0020B7C39C|nr:hypothetical protein [Macrococcus canis]UTH07158.1 hypothetical protein KFV07_01685 [Macrococcus canis]
MKKFNNLSIEDLLKDEQVTVTISEELEASAAYSEKDEIKLKNLIKEAREQLQNQSSSTIDKFEDQFKIIGENSKELLNATGGLCIFITEEDIKYFHLDIPVENISIVGNAPHLKPLIINYQYNRNFHVLVLNRDEVRLFDASHNSIEEVTDKDLPLKLEEVLGEELVGGELSHGTFGSKGTSNSVDQTFHGHNETSKEKEIDRERFFRYVDEFIYENYSEPQKKPLLLYGLKENLSEFRKVSKNNFLKETEIDVSGSKVSDEEIKQNIKEVTERIVNNEKSELLEEVKEMNPSSYIEENFEELSMAAIQGRIEKLLISEEYTPDGSIGIQGEFIEDDSDYSKQLTKLVLQNGGKVYYLEKDDLLDGKNIIAVLRY